jgi:hypothetical protein
MSRLWWQATQGMAHRQALDEMHQWQGGSLVHHVVSQAGQQHMSTHSSHQVRAMYRDESESVAGHGSHWRASERRGRQHTLLQRAFGNPSTVVISLFCQTGVVLWLTSLLNAVSRQLGTNEPLAQVPHQQAILARRLPNLTEEGYS